jgi:hypothetical protein
LPNWPATPGDPNPRSGNKAPRPDQIVLTRVAHRRPKNRVVFTGEFEGAPHTYDYEAEHPVLAKHIETILRKHIGKTVMHLGDIEIDEDALIRVPQLLRTVKTNALKVKPRVRVSNPRPGEEGELGTERSSN